MSLSTYATDAGVVLAAAAVGLLTGHAVADGSLAALVALLIAAEVGVYLLRRGGAAGDPVVGPMLVLTAAATFLHYAVKLLRPARPAKKCYDQVLTMIADEQGDWYVEKVLSGELAKILRHYSRDLEGGGDDEACGSAWTGGEADDADDGGAAKDEEDDDDEEEEGDDEDDDNEEDGDAKNDDDDGDDDSEDGATEDSDDEGAAEDHTGGAILFNGAGGVVDDSGDEDSELKADFHQKVDETIEIFRAAELSGDAENARRVAFAHAILLINHEYARKHLRSPKPQVGKPEDGEPEDGKPEPEDGEPEVGNPEVGKLEDVE